MQAVIRTGGKQYYVTAGDIVEVEKLAGDIGDTITLDDILMIANDDDVTVGQPTVADAAVTAKITGQYRGNKIQVFRYRPKKRIRVRRGHRQYLTRLEIESIKFGDIEYVAPEPEPVAPPVVEEPEEEPVETVAEEPEAETTETEAMADEAVTAEADTEETVAEATEETVTAEDNTPAADEADDESSDDSEADADDADAEEDSKSKE